MLIILKYYIQWLVFFNKLHLHVLQNSKTLIDHHCREHGKVAVANIWNRGWGKDLERCSSA